MKLKGLLREIEACRVCAAHLPLGPRPVVRVGEEARLLIIGQAPGTQVHATGVPWNDPSGDRLRSWMGVSREAFYDTHRIAIMPMGFCYPGRGKGGDLPPRPECAPLWHAKIRAFLPHLELTLLVGSYAQAYYLGKERKPSLADTVAAWREYLPRGFLPLVHPSPRNQRWLREHPWFERDVVPALREQVRQHLRISCDARQTHPMV